MSETRQALHPDLTPVTTCSHFPEPQGCFSWGRKTCRGGSRVPYFCSGPQQISLQRAVLTRVCGPRLRPSCFLARSEVALGLQSCVGSGGPAGWSKAEVLFRERKGGLQGRQRRPRRESHTPRFSSHHLPVSPSLHQTSRRNNCGQRGRSFCTEGRGSRLLISQHPARQGVHFHGLYRKVVTESALRGHGWQQFSCGLGNNAVE